jgi:hypothetical protein
MSGLDQQLLDRRAEQPMPKEDHRTSDYDHAVFALQQDMPIIPKLKDAEVQTKTGRDYSYKYADLADLWEVAQPLLGKHGLSYTGRLMLDEQGRLVLRCRLLHVDSGGYEISDWPIRSDAPASRGSEITFGRRYCFGVMTNTITEKDDDAAAAEAEAQTHRGTAQRAARTQQHRPPPSAGTGRATAQRARTTDGPALPGEPEPATTPQIQKIAIALGEFGVADRDERLRLTGSLVGRELASGKDLTKAQAHQVIDLTLQAKEQPEPLAWLLQQIPDDPTDGGEAS